MDQIVLTLSHYVPIFMLVLARTMALALGAPYIGTQSVPAMVRVGVTLSLAFFYLLGNPNLPAEIPQGFLPYTMLLIQEFLTGMLFAFSANIILYAIQAGGEIIDVQIGLSMVMQFNPQTKARTTVIGKFLYQLALIVLITSYAHLFMLQAYFKTFEILPIGTFDYGSNLGISQLIKICAQVFDVSAQIALPIIIVIFVVDFGLGMMNRVAPQINILELNFAMKPTTGALLILIIFSTLMSVMEDFSYRLALDAQSAVTAVAEGKRWRQLNQNQQFVAQQQQQGLPPGFPQFQGLPGRGPVVQPDTPMDTMPAN
ncbi:MAG: flagellar biosynthetic protein FliR [Candidatus Sericytochromatia bacterium]